MSDLFTPDLLRSYMILTENSPPTPLFVKSISIDNSFPKREGSGVSSCKSLAIGVGGEFL